MITNKKLISKLKKLSTWDLICVVGATAELISCINKEGEFDYKNLGKLLEWVNKK